MTELDHVAIDADVVRIGALRRIAALEADAELAAALPALVECAARIAYPAVRNRGTIGGNVAYADPASGVPPVLLAHDGEVVLTGRPAAHASSRRTAFFTGLRTTACGPDELVTELRFRRPGPRGGAAFHEVSRRARGWGLAGACAVVELDEGGRIAELRIGLLGLAPTAVRAERAEGAAVGRAPEAEAIAALAEDAVADLDRHPG